MRRLGRQKEDLLNHSEASTSLAGKKEHWLIVVDT